MAKEGSSPEVMLAQEQAVIRRGPGVRKEVEGAFGLGGETEGTLVLTDKRLVYVHGNEKKESLRIGAWSAKRLFFSDVESLDAMPLDSASVEIPVDSISRVKGHRGEATDPKLEVEWNDKAGATKSTEFVEQITGGSRRKNLNDWAGVIEKLKAGKLKISSLPPAPGTETLEWKILGVLGDMQEKGALAIESEVEEKYKLDLDPDEVEEACEKLVSTRLVKEVVVKGEDTYYRKVSPLGEDDLSA